MSCAVTLSASPPPPLPFFDSPRTSLLPTTPFPSSPDFCKNDSFCLSAFSSSSPRFMTIAPPPPSPPPPPPPPRHARLPSSSASFSNDPELATPKSWRKPFLCPIPTPPSSSLPIPEFHTPEFPRSVLGVRSENHLSELPSNSVVRRAGSFQELNRSKVKNIRCLNDRTRDIQGIENSPALSKSGRSPLKRKRPPKLDIPESEIIATPSSFQEQVNEINVGGPTYGVSCKKGRRDILEDAYRIVPNFQGHPRQAFFGIFDGHSGCSAVEYVAENLPQEIASAIEASQKGDDLIEEAVTSAFLATDAGFLRKDVDSGASCATAIVSNGYLVVANAGDCRIVMSRAGKAEALTQDHKAEREDERQRIEKLGGYVDCFNGVWRVQGVLAVSRGFGDRHLKEFIPAKPEVKKLPLTPECEFLILASDGLWDKVGNQEAVDCARAVLEDPNRFRTAEAGVESNVQMPGSTSNSNDPRFLDACKKLVDLASSRGSIDDISVIIAHLEQFC